MSNIELPALVFTCPCCGQPAPSNFGRRIMVAEIQRHVAAYYGFPVDEMRSTRRGRLIARPRQVAMMLSKRFTPMSLPEIGRRFNRDHSTVIHACRQVERLCAIDEDVAKDVRLLTGELERISQGIAQL